MRVEELAIAKGYKVSKDGTLCGPKGCPVRCRVSNSGYYSKSIRRQDAYGKFSVFMVHRLQAYQKFGNAIYEEHTVVRHLNGNKLDNSSDNIAIGSYSDNVFDIPAKDRILHSLVACSKRTDRYPLEKVRMVKEDRKSGMSYNRIKEKHCIRNKSTVRYMCSHTYFGLDRDI